MNKTLTLDTLRKNRKIQSKIQQKVMQSSLRNSKLKRVIDVLGSLSALAALSPLMVGTALIIKGQDGGSVLFRQKRVGTMGKPFYMLKFRSMRMGADAMKASLLAENQHKEGVTFKIKDDPRITRFGKFIRKYSIDELPQLLNVLKGEMSLVGPRPAVPSEVAQYRSEHLIRLHAKPGITCIWQISGRANIDFEGQVKLDKQYTKEQGFSKDLEILVKTVPAVISADGSF